MSERYEDEAVDSDDELLDSEESFNSLLVRTYIVIAAIIGSIAGLIILSYFCWGL